MSRTKEIAKSSASLFTAEVLISIISILFLALFARVFTKEQMALLAFTEILTEWTQLIGSIGLGTLVIKDVAILNAKGEHNKVNQLISSVVLYRTVSFFLLSIIIFITCPILTKLVFDTNEFIPLIRFLVCISFLSSVRWALTEVQVATQKFYSKSILNVVIVLIQRIFCIIGFFTYGVDGFFFGYFIALFIGVFLILFDLKKYFNIHIIPFFSIFRKSKSYMMLDLMRGFMTHIDRPVIAFFLGAEILAGFYVAKRIYDNVLHLLSAVVVPTGVKFGEVKVEGHGILRNYFNQSISISGSFFIPLGFFLMVISPPMVTLYAGNKYISDIPIAVAFGFTLMCISIWAILREAALRLISPYQLMYQYIVSSVITLICYILFLPRLGAIAVPIANGFAYLTGIIPTLYFLKKYYRFSIPYKDLLYATFCGFALLLLFIPEYSIINPILEIIIILACSGLIYLIWLLYWAPSEVRLLLKRTYPNIPFIN